LNTRQGQLLQNIASLNITSADTYPAKTEFLVFFLFKLSQTESEKLLCGRAGTQEQALAGKGIMKISLFTLNRERVSENAREQLERAREHCFVAKQLNMYIKIW